MEGAASEVEIVNINICIKSSKATGGALQAIALHATFDKATARLQPEV